LELDLGKPGWKDLLGRAFAEAAAIDCLVDVAFSVDDSGTAYDEMRRLAEEASAQRCRIGRWLVFSRIAWSTPAALVQRARQILGPIDERIPLVAGTLANFLELNRADLPWDQLDGLCFTAHPQEHAFDNSSLIENLEGLASAIESARALGAGLPVEVGPITLRKRVNPYATGPAAEPERGVLPARVDPRQMSLFGAAWTLGAIKHLAEQRAARATFYETTGWRGVMEAACGPPLPEQFRSFPGQVFPMFHVFADVNEFRGGEVLLSRSTHPLTVDGIVLRRGPARRLLLANFTPKDLEIRIDGLGRQTRIRRLDATNATQDAEAARRFRADPGPNHATVGRGYPLAIGPYALARLDTE
jgi:D-apionolactonase